MTDPQNPPAPNPETIEKLGHVSVATLATALFKRGQPLMALG